MSSRRGSSRTLGPVKQCAVYERGRRRCVWCQRRLRAPHTDGGRDTVTATIDHYDGDGHNQARGNLLPCCRTCNNMRRWAEAWAIYLGGHGQTVERAEKRAAEQLAAPLDYEAGRALARRWHPNREAQIRAARQGWLDRRRTGRSTADFPFGRLEVA